MWCAGFGPWAPNLVITTVAHELAALHDYGAFSWPPAYWADNRHNTVNN